MASNARCLSILLLALTFSFQTHARDSKFLTKETISVSPTQAPTLSPTPSPEPEIVEHGYGLYGQDMYENYEHPTTTTKTTPQSTSMEFEKAYSNNNFNGNNEYVSKKQGMSDTRFLENGKYYYDVNYEKEQNARFNTNNNENLNKNFEEEKQGLSDTQFLENGKYFNDVNNEEKEANSEENFDDEFNVNNNNENENEKYYNAYNENENNKYNSNNNNEYVNRYNGNGNNEYETQGRDGYNYQHNEYHAKEGRGVYNYPKKFPKYEYDTMEEYDREQGLH